MGLCSRRPTRVPLLTKRHSKSRLLWAREHQAGTMDKWKKIAWSNELRPSIHHVDDIHVSMTSRRRMEDSERWRAVGCIEKGQSITDVALFFGVHHSATSRLWKQFQTTQTVVRRLVAGRPRVTTPAEDRYIATADKRNRRATFTRVTSMVAASIGKAISAATVCRRLHMRGLYARGPRGCVPLSVQSRGARLQWCREHVIWNVSERGKCHVYWRLKICSGTR
ncbi:hypothetical protein X975_07595, partial [Stegodyphus mimosarum]